MLAAAAWPVLAALLAVGSARLRGQGWPSALGAGVAWSGLAALVASGFLVWPQPRLARVLGGWEAMLAAHHRAGLAGYALLLLHALWVAVVPAWGRPDAARWAWHRLWPWGDAESLLGGLATLAWAWTGWLALLGLMLGLAATFARRLPYRLWRRLHLGMVAAVGLGLAHLLVLRGLGPATVAAMALAALAFGVRRLATQGLVSGLDYRVVDVQRPAPGVVEATLEPEQAPQLDAHAGQYVLARFRDGAGYRACGEFHPFTLSALLPDGRLRVAIKALGPCSWRLQGLRTGVPVRLQGPFGHFLGRVDGAPQLWVAGGIGITPFMAQLRQGRCAQPTRLVYLAGDEATAAFVDELREAALRDPQLQLQLQTTGDAPPDATQLAAWLGQALAGLDAHQVQVQVCGPRGLQQALQPALAQLGIGPDAVHAEQFDPR